MNSHAFSPSLYDAPVASRASFDKWLGRVCVLLLVAGPGALYAMGAPTAQLTTAGAWGYVAATLGCVLGVVTGVACLTGHMNDH